LAKRNDASPHFGIILGIWMQECDAPHALRLLGVRRRQPRSCRAAERGQEFSSGVMIVNAECMKFDHVGGRSRSFWPLAGPWLSRPSLSRWRITVGSLARFRTIQVCPKD
jgi:hypothetical protein